MKVKTSELSGAALDWAVAKCEGGFNLRLVSTYGTKTAWIFSLRDDEDAQRIDHFYLADSSPSTEWAQGGPLIEREGITTSKEDGCWSAYFRDKLFEEDGSEHWSVGETPLIAACRCYVASKLGEEVNIPEGLL